MNAFHIFYTFADFMIDGKEIVLCNGSSEIFYDDFVPIMKANPVKSIIVSFSPSEDIDSMVESFGKLMRLLEPIHVHLQSDGDKLVSRLHDMFDLAPSLEAVTLGWRMWNNKVVIPLNIKHIRFTELIMEIFKVPDHVETLVSFKFPSDLNNIRHLKLDNVITFNGKSDVLETLDVYGNVHLNNLPSLKALKVPKTKTWSSTLEYYEANEVPVLKSSDVSNIQVMRLYISSTTDPKSIFDRHPKLQKLILGFYQDQKVTFTNKKDDSLSSLS
jgi:hypothetical protein